MEERSLTAPLVADGPAVELTVSWRFEPGHEEAVSAYAGRFAEPFWAKFDVGNDGEARSIAVDGGATVTETLTHQSDAGYAYTATGVPGISDYAGSFAVMADSVAAELSWTTTFRATDAASLARMLTINAGGAAAIGAGLAERFRPPPAG